MKKLIVFILICAAGYFVYENFIVEKEVLEILRSSVQPAQLIGGKLLGISMVLLLEVGTSSGRKL